MSDDGNHRAPGASARRGTLDGGDVAHFKLGRPDVFPAGDFGVRDGFRHVYGLDAIPTPSEILAHAERWRPHATTAAWYFWQAANAARKKPPTAGSTLSNRPPLGRNNLRHGDCQIGKGQRLNRLSTGEGEGLLN